MRPLLPRPFPDDREVMLLRAALAGPDQAPASWRRWKQAGGSPEQAHGAAFQLLPLVYRNLVSCGVDEAALTELRAAHRHAWSANQRLFHAVAPVIDALDEAGIETLALKGAALALGYYADSGSRPMGDFDLLVHLRDARRAADVLDDRGWTVDPDVPLERLLATRHAVSCRTPEHELDLHWSALYQPGDDASFWNRSVPLSVHGAGTRALCAEDQLIHVCLHGVGVDPGPLRWVADALMVMRGAELDWRLVIDEARRREAIVPLRAALEFLSERFGAPVPDPVLRALADIPTGIGERLAHRAATSTRRGRGFAVEWRRHRMLRRLEPALTAPSYLSHLQYMWGLPNRRQLFARLTRKVVQVARYGYSHPSGDRRPRGGG